MAFSEAHVLYAVKKDSTVIGGVTGQGLPIQTTLRNDSANGLPYTTHLAIAAQSFNHNFETRSIAVALAAIGLSGVSIAGLTNKLTLYAQKVAEGGTRASGSNHRTYTYNAGLVFPDRLSCQHQQDASLTYAIRPTWNGTNNPVVIAESAALASNPLDNERFSLGPVVVGGTTFDQISGIDINFGINVRTESADGEIWDRFGWIETFAPTITLRGRKVTWFKDSAGVPLGGLAATHVNTSIYLRKRASGGMFVADVTAEHVKFTAAGLAVIDEAGSFRGTGPGETTLTIHPYYDGTNHPILVTTATAIS